MGEITTTLTYPYHGGAATASLGGNFGNRGPTAGATNEGGGGGGRGGNGGGSASGGSGLVSIRYSSSFANASSTTGSPSFTNTGTYKIYTWTGSGSITF